MLGRRSGTALGRIVVEVMLAVAEKKPDFAERAARLQSPVHRVTPDPDGTFEHAELNALCALWRRKANGSLPLRAAFTLRDLAPFASHIAIVERHADGRYSYRLFGSDLVALVGECTHKYIDECFSKERYAIWKADFDLVLDCAGPVRFVSHYETSVLSYLIGESFAAPLADPKGGAPNLIIAAVYMKAKVGAPCQDSRSSDCLSVNS